MPRDNFSEETKRILAERVSYKCSNLKCRQATSGPGLEVNKSVRVGVACHITAASPGTEIVPAPRYNPDLSKEERSSITNGIHLCQNCAKLIDSDPKRYPVELLNEWKADAEDRAIQELKGISSEKGRKIVLSRHIKSYAESYSHRYQLIFSVENLTDKVTQLGFIEIKIPSRVVLDGPCQATFDLNNKEICIFRKDLKGENLFPRGQKDFQVIYEMNQKLHNRGHHLYSLPVSFKYYDTNGDLVDEMACNFGECQNF